MAVEERVADVEATRKRGMTALRDASVGKREATRGSVDEIAEAIHGSAVLIVMRAEMRGGDASKICLS